MTGVLIKKGNLGTEITMHTGRARYKNEWGDWGDASPTSQGMVKIASKPSEVSREVQIIYLLTAF